LRYTSGKRLVVAPCNGTPRTGKWWVERLVGRIMAGSAAADWSPPELHKNDRGFVGTWTLFSMYVYSLLDVYSCILERGS